MRILRLIVAGLGCGLILGCTETPRPETHANQTVDFAYSAEEQLVELEATLTGRGGAEGSDLTEDSRQKWDAAKAEFRQAAVTLQRHPEDPAREDAFNNAWERLLAIHSEIRTANQ